MMWIKSQKVLKLLNVEKIESFECVNEKIFANYEAVDVNGLEIYSILAIYKNHERALEVFKDLQEWLGIETYRKSVIESLHETDYKLDDMKQVLKTYSEVYVMPEE